VADKPPLPHEEVQRILHQLEPLIAERKVLLVGAMTEPLTSRRSTSRAERRRCGGQPTS
jgi:hypothetical protein